MKSFFSTIASLPIFAVGVLAVLVLWLCDMAERAYWHKYAKLRMGASDGYHVMVGDRCYTK